MYKDPTRIRISVRSLLILCLIGIAVVALSKVLVRRVEKTGHKQMVLAARKAEQSWKVLREAGASEGIAIDPILDPGLTGVIGEEYTAVTTTLGNLAAKQTSLNPDFAALILDLLRSQGVGEGDRIAIQASASFPALTISAIIACETIGSVPVLSVSLGSSAFGANRPEWTYLDMESRLIAKGIIQTRSALVTPGGENDNGSSLIEGGLELITLAAQRNGYRIYIPEDLEDAVRNKWNRFNRGRGVKMFINIGGNQAALGSGRFPSGLILPPVDPDRLTEQNLIARFLGAGIPVLNLLEIRDLAHRHRIAVSPQIWPQPGEGDVYFRNDIPAVFWWIGLAVMLSGMVLTRIRKRNLE